MAEGRYQELMEERYPGLPCGARERARGRQRAPRTPTPKGVTRSLGRTRIGSNARTPGASRRARNVQTALAEAGGE